MRTALGALTGIALLLLSCAEEDYKVRFQRDMLTEPWGAVTIEESVCVSCHDSDLMTPEQRQIPDEWRQSWHYAHDVSCHDCHGGDPEDEVKSMSPERGFVGIPADPDVPEFCGKCHIGILKHYMESGHGLALKQTGIGPTCVTCHGDHRIQKASIDIISEQLCTRCHGFERARIMKAALLVTERKIVETEGNLAALGPRGVYTEDYEKTLFRIQAEFRTLFHTIDVDTVKEKTDEFTESVAALDSTLAGIFRELAFRRSYSAAVMLIFLALGVTILLIRRTHR